ncbi:hypothetical protein [Arthrobacter sp. S2(2024)]|uniref:hypothetical protein n=1 Tax=Arthrobacter sp. S2(2024) TaxID=3111911 RepID=UPI002FC86217
MIYFDPHGTKLGESPTGAWGINQAPIIGANHRPCDLVDTAPEGVGLVILSQFWAPKVRFNEILTGVEQAVKDITTAIVYIEQFCQNNPTLCSWVTNAASGPVPGDAGGGDGTATAVSEKESSTVN